MVREGLGKKLYQQEQVVELPILIPKEVRLELDLKAREA